MSGTIKTTGIIKNKFLYKKGLSLFSIEIYLISIINPSTTFYLITNNTSISRRIIINFFSLCIYSREPTAETERPVRKYEREEIVIF